MWRTSRLLPNEFLNQSSQLFDHGRAAPLGLAAKVNANYLRRINLYRNRRDWSNSLRARIQPLNIRYLRPEAGEYDHLRLQDTWLVKLNFEPRIVNFDRSLPERPILVIKQCRCLVPKSKASHRSHWTLLGLPPDFLCLLALNRPFQLNPVWKTKRCWIDKNIANNQRSLIEFITTPDY